MGGEIKECGCYDGPWAPDDPQDVSIRCPDHTLAPGYRAGALRMTTYEASISRVTATRRALAKGLLQPNYDDLPRMAVPKSRVRP